LPSQVACLTFLYSQVACLTFLYSQLVSDLTPFVTCLKEKRQTSILEPLVWQCEYCKYI
jgi:hypothetical protein